MSSLDLDAIQSRADAATAGPWLTRTEVDGVRAGRPTVVSALDPRSERWARIVTVDQTRPHIEPAEPNAEFIAAARTDVPALVAALRRVEALTVTTDGGDLDGAFDGNTVADIRAAIRGDES